MVLSKNNELLYDLEDRPPANRTLIYAVQWLGFTVANTAVLPIVVGSALSSTRPALPAWPSALSFSGTGVAAAGVLWPPPAYYRRPAACEGCFYYPGVMAPGLGNPEPAAYRPGVRRYSGRPYPGGSGPDGSHRQGLKTFTPAVTGSVLVLLGLQLSGTFVRNARA